MTWWSKSHGVIGGPVGDRFPDASARTSCCLSTLALIGIHFTRRPTSLHPHGHLHVGEVSSGRAEPWILVLLAALSGESLRVERNKAPSMTTILGRLSPSASVINDELVPYLVTKRLKLLRILRKGAGSPQPTFFCDLLPSRCLYRLPISSANPLC